MILGIALFLVTPAAAVFTLPAWAGMLNTTPGIALSVLALGLIALDRMTNKSSLMARMYSLSILSVALVVVIHHGARPLMAERHDLRSISKKIGSWQEQGIPVAYIGKYHGQFQFMGRLKQPISAVGQTDTDVSDWLAAHPEGRIIVISGAPSTKSLDTFNYPYRGRYFTIFAVADVIADPSLLN